MRFTLNEMGEAAIVAARRDKTEISYDEIDYSIDRLTVGMQKTTGVTFPNRQRLVAYHEAGHAVMGALTPDYDMVTKVTIIESGRRPTLRRTVRIHPHVRWERGGSTF